jgi:hypothetical protein
MVEILRLCNDPGPISKTVDSSSRSDGHARLALTAEPPDPRKNSLNDVYLAIQMLLRWIWIRVMELSASIGHAGYAKQQKLLIFDPSVLSFGLGCADKSLNLRLMRLL